jgi:hypothetical protein
MKVQPERLIKFDDYNECPANLRWPSVLKNHLYL